MKKFKNKEVIIALKQIAERNDGILHPEAVVAAARSQKSPLHDYFTWDDTKAAREHRLQQARQLLSVVVEYVGSESHGREQRVFVSLRKDRAEDGGYRPLVNVLESPQLRDALLRDVLQEMAFFRQKYAELKELVIVFQAMTTTEQRLKKRHGRLDKARLGSSRRAVAR